MTDAQIIGANVSPPERNDDSERAESGSGSKPVPGQNYITRDEFEEAEKRLDEKAERVVQEAERAKTMSYLGLLVLAVMVAALCFSYWELAGNRNYYERDFAERLLRQEMRAEYIDINFKDLYDRNSYLK